jgi:hypothetical protein
MIVHLIRETETRPWLELGWIDHGASHLQGWNILWWVKPGTPVAPFGSYLAETHPAPPRETNAEDNP